MDKGKSEEKKNLIESKEASNNKKDSSAQEYNVPLIFKLFHLLSPFCVIGFGTLYFENHIYGFWAFYVVNCLIYPLLVLNLTPYYTQAWKRVKKTTWLPIDGKRNFKETFTIAFVFFIGFWGLGYMNRASNVCMYKEELSKYCIGDSIVITPTKALMIVGAIFLIGFVNPILEEFYWRLFTVEILKTGESDESSNNISGGKGQDSSKLVWLTSFAFGLHHFWMQCSVPQPFCCYLENGVPGGIGFIFVCMVLGLVFHWQKNRGGMFNAWLVHFGLNIGQLFCMYLESVVNAEVAIL